MSILKAVQDAWGWCGIVPDELVSENDFGNIILKDEENRFWRLCPEDLYCNIVANSISEYNALIKDEEFLSDWFMASMVQEAKKALGELKEGYKYYMVIPGALGGEYGGSNVKTLPLRELIHMSGDIAKKIKDLPDGAQVELTVQR
jgi:hypothetical protein